MTEMATQLVAQPLFAAKGAMWRCFGLAVLNMLGSSPSFLVVPASVHPTLSSPPLYPSFDIADCSLILEGFLLDGHLESVLQSA